jgi:predicted metallo-beta-lactamase superfamily hydrolase
VAWITKDLLVGDKQTQQNTQDLLENQINRAKKFGEEADDAEIKISSWDPLSFRFRLIDSLFVKTVKK